MGAGVPQDLPVRENSAKLVAGLEVKTVDAFDSLVVANLEVKDSGSSPGAVSTPETEVPSGSSPPLERIAANVDAAGWGDGELHFDASRRAANRMLDALE